MTHLRQRERAPQPVTFVTIGVRGELAAAIAADAKSYAKVLGVTFGSLVMEALAQYMNRAHLEAQEALSEAEGRG